MSAQEAHVQTYFLGAAVAEWILLVSLIVGFANMWLGQLVALIRAWRNTDDEAPADEDRLPGYAEVS
jgi:vacuolar-type H+-ATPase subunit I/STV1